MRKLSVIALLVLCSSVAGFAQKYKLENKLLECVHDQGHLSGIDIPYQFNKYERYLIKKQLLEDNSGKSYYELFSSIATGKWADLSSPYSLIDSLRSNIENFSDGAANSHSCVEKSKKILSSKAFEKTKLYQLNKNLVHLQFANNLTPQTVAGNITVVLSPAELDNQFYKYVALAQIYYAYNSGVGAVFQSSAIKAKNSGKRNNVLIYVDERNDSVKVNGRDVAISQLKKTLHDQFIPYPDKADAPEVETVQIDLIGELERVKLTIELQGKTTTPFLTYISIQNIISDVYKKLRNELSFIHFGVTFEQLKDERKRKAILSAVPQRYVEQPAKE